LQAVDSSASLNGCKRGGSKERNDSADAKREAIDTILGLSGPADLIRHRDTVSELDNRLGQILELLPVEWRLEKLSDLSHQRDVSDRAGGVSSVAADPTP
jgi:hypothetical protein